MTNAEIVAYGWYVPEQVLDNEFFVRNNPYSVYIGEDENRNPLFKPELVKLTYEDILKATVIKERRKMLDSFS